MKKIINLSGRSLALLLLIAVLLAACSPAAAPAPVEPTTPPAAEPTALPATDTPAPTPTLEAPTAVPTETALPTATALPELGVLPDGFAAWCMPAKLGINRVGDQPEVMPANAWAGKIENGQMRLRAPGSFCTLTFTFNQPAPAGAMLKFYSGKLPNSWLSIPLVPAASNPNMAVATYNHAALVNPPAWEVNYRVAVVSADGKELRTDGLTIFKALPARCWDNTLPDPVTLYCKNLDGDWNVDRPWTWPTPGGPAPTPAE